MNDERTILDARREWSERRGQHRGLGASDAATVLGLSPYKTPLTLWLELTGRAERESISDTGYGSWGTIHEPTLLRETAMRHDTIVLGHDEWLEPCFYAPSGRCIPKGSGQYLDLTVSEAEKMIVNVDGLLSLQHPNHPWLVAHPDGYAMEARNGVLYPKAMIQVKTAGHYFAKDWGEEGTDEIPDDYIVQVACEAALFSYEAVDPLPVWLPVLIGGNTFKVLRVEPPAKLCQYVIDKMVAFWTENVEGDVAPDPKDADDHAAALKVLYPQDDDQTLIATTDMIELAAQLKVAAEASQIAYEHQKEIENQIKELMGEAKKIQGDRWSVSWYDTKGGIDYVGLVKELGADQDLIEKFRRPSYRTFRPTLKNLEV